MGNLHLDRLEARLQRRSEALLRGRDPQRAADGLAAPGLEPRLAAAAACRDCGGLILAARVEAVPGAERCVSCQRSFERAS